MDTQLLINASGIACHAQAYPNESNLLRNPALGRSRKRLDIGPQASFSTKGTLIKIDTTFAMIGGAFYATVQWKRGPMACSIDCRACKPQEVVSKPSILSGRIERRSVLQGQRPAPPVNTECRFLGQKARLTRQLRQSMEKSILSKMLTSFTRNSTRTASLLPRPRPKSIFFKQRTTLCGVI